MNAIVVRAARRHDAAALVEMLLRLNAEIRALGHVVEDRITEEILVADGLKRDAWINAFIAEIDGDPVGCLAWYRGYDTEQAIRQLRVSGLYVAPSGRRLGVAVKMVEALIVVARAHGAGEIIWSVEPENKVALAFYQRIGAKVWMRNRVMYLKLGEQRQK